VEMNCFSTELRPPPPPPPPRPVLFSAFASAVSDPFLYFPGFLMITDPRHPRLVSTTAEPVNGRLRSFPCYYPAHYSLFFSGRRESTRAFFPLNDLKGALALCSVVMHFRTKTLRKSLPQPLARRGKVLTQAFLPRDFFCLP